MLFFALFTVLSALLNRVVSIPLPAYRPTAGDSNSRSTLYRRAPPKFEIPVNFVASSQRKEVLDKMKEHYDTQATDAQKRAKLATASSRWNRHGPGREYMNFDYHEGDTIDSPIIHPVAELYRDKPVPKICFSNVLAENQKEMRIEAVKRYNDLGQDEADRVKSMRLWGNWDANGGIREKAKLTFHSTVKAANDRVIGDPMTIHRPLTLQIPDVPPANRLSIIKSVRVAQAMAVADPQHPATTSNYGTVHSDWHYSPPDEVTRKRHRQVMVKLEEVSEDEKRRKHLGNYAVRKGASGYEFVGLNTGSPSSQTGPSHPSHAGPSGLHNEVAHPSNSQEQQHSNVGSPSTHALSSNSGSSQLNSQGSQQFNTGSPSSHLGPSHSELSYPVSPQQPLQPHIGSPALHNEFHTPPEVWRSRDPLSQPSHDVWPSSHPDLYSDAGSPHIPSNNQILPHPNSPLSHPGLSHPEHAQSSSPVPPSQQLPLVGLPPNPSELPHSSQQGAELSPEIWHILNPDPVYPYPWNPDQRSP